MEENKSLSNLILDSLRLKGMSVEKLAQVTGISEMFLEQLLEEKFEKLPSYPYMRGYLIKIGNVLNLDGEKLWQEYIRHNQAIKSSGRHDRLPSNRFAFSLFGKKAIYATIALLFFAGYMSFRLADFFQQPKLDLENITETMTVKTKELKIKGKINPKNNLTLNNEEVYADKDGNFEKDILLQTGFNTLTFKIKKFLGKEFTVTKQVFYEEEIATSSENIILQNEN